MIQIIHVGFEHYDVIDYDRYLIFIISVIDENICLKTGSIYSINENESLFMKIDRELGIQQMSRLFIEEIGELTIYYNLINENTILDKDCESISYLIYDSLNSM